MTSQLSTIVRHGLYIDEENARRTSTEITVELSAEILGGVKPMGYYNFKCCLLVNCLVFNI